MSNHLVYSIGEKITSALESVVTACLTLILVTTITLVTLRYGFNSSIKGADELSNYLFIYMTALGAPAAIFRGDHIALTVLVERISPLRQRAVDVLVHLLIILVNMVILYLSFSWISGVGSFVSPVLRVPNWIIQLSVPIGCSATILISIVKILTTGERNAAVAD